MQRKNTFLLFFMSAVLLFAVDGCTVAGYFVGQAWDKSAAVEMDAPAVDAMDDISPGDSVTFMYVDGSSLRGYYIGAAPMSGVGGPAFPNRNGGPSQQTVALRLLIDGKMRDVPLAEITSIRYAREPATGRVVLVGAGLVIDYLLLTNMPSPLGGNMFSGGSF